MTPLDILHSARNLCYSGIKAALPVANQVMPFTRSFIAIYAGAYVGTKCYPSQEFKTNDVLSMTGMPYLFKNALQVTAIATGVLTTCLVTALLNPRTPVSASISLLVKHTAIVGTLFGSLYLYTDYTK